MKGPKQTLFWSGHKMEKSDLHNRMSHICESLHDTGMNRVYRTIH